MTLAIIALIIAIYVAGWLISAVIGSELCPYATPKECLIITFMWPLWWPTTAIALLLAIDHIIPQTISTMGKRATQAILRRLV